MHEPLLLIHRISTLISINRLSLKSSASLVTVHSISIRSSCCHSIYYKAHGFNLQKINKLSGFKPDNCGTTIVQAFHYHGNNNNNNQFSTMVSPRISLAKNRGTICVEGNIGCGKTTFLDFFRQRFQAAGQPDPGVIAEPVEKWRNVEGENLFQYLYKDPARYSLAFQTYVQLTMMKLHLKNPKMMERSIYSARYCFVENLYELNYLSKLEYVILDKWFKHLVLADDDILLEQNQVKGVDSEQRQKLEYEMLCQPKGVKLDMIIYLRCTPQKVMDRIRVRSRTEEKDISLEYIQSLHNLHEDWLINSKFPVPAPVLVIDTNCEQSSLIKRYQQAAPYIWGEKELTHSPTIITLDDESSRIRGY